MSIEDFIHSYLGNRPILYPKPRYVKLPPSNNLVERLAFILMKYKHGTLEYEPCVCCTEEAQQILPELLQLFGVHNESKR